jgi:tubulin polyglutamylase TTLL6/13
MSTVRSLSKTVAINLNHTKYTIIAECATDLGWRIVDSSRKTLLFWCDSYGTIDFASTLERWQFYNHFPGMGTISQKVDLARLSREMSQLFPQFYNFQPNSFILPDERSGLKAALSKSNCTYIVKPDRGSQGRGITIIQDPTAVDLLPDSSVAQEYVTPCLIGGLKFDLRIYILVSSIDTLRLYLHTEGMARFCTEAYEPPNSSNLDDCYSHLTNFSLNKHNSKFCVTEEGGHKRYLSQVFRDLEQSGADIEKLQRDIDQIVRLTLLASQSRISQSYHSVLTVTDGKSRCFEILGFDILIDERHRPWLLEVNSMPSLQTSSKLDHDLKKQVIMGALQILDISPNFKAESMDWFREMSLGQSVQPLFDPNRESQIAKSTGWRQLWPIVDDPESRKVCESIEQVMRSEVRTRATQIRRGSQPSRLLTPKSALGVARSSRTSVAKELPVAPSCPVLVTMPEPRPFSRQRLLARDPPRSIVLAKEVRLNRMMALDRVTQAWDDPRSFVTTGFSVNTFSPREERDRMKVLQGQVVKAAALGFDQLIRRCLGEIGSSVSSGRAVKSQSYASLLEPSIARILPVPTS